MRACLTERSHLQVGKFFGLEDADYPAFAIHDQAADGKYISKHVKAGSVKKYVKDFLVRPRWVSIRGKFSVTPGPS